MIPEEVPSASLWHCFSGDKITAKGAKDAKKRRFNPRGTEKNF